MKKLAYIILVIAILLVISHFVKQNTPARSVAETMVETIAVEPAAEAVENETEVSEPAVHEDSAENDQAIPAEDTDVVDVQEDIIIDDQAPEDDGAIDVEETNPEQTADEDETIIE